MGTHVVVTCSKRKKDNAQSIRLSRFRDSTVEGRAAKWIEALTRDDRPKFPARDLYQGEHWSLLRDPLFGPTVDRNTDVWVLSAGYGLVPFDAMLRPYAATFSRHHPDTIFDPVFELPFDKVAGRWWNALASWEGPANASRSLVRVVEEDPECALLVAASPVYLRAIENELATASKRMQAPERLLIFSAGSRANGRRESDILDFDGRLRGYVGGSLMALNVRVLTAVLKHAQSLDRPSVQHMLNDWSQVTPASETVNRRRLQDEEVREFLRNELDADPEAGWTLLLRKLRHELGGACAQNRFQRLYHEVSE